MTAYSVCLRGPDRDPQDVRTIDCANDDDAIRYAASFDHTGDIDVWQARRHVAHFHEVAGAVMFFSAPGWGSAANPA